MISYLITEYVIGNENSEKEVILKKKFEYLVIIIKVQGRLLTF